jgi:NAD+ kinase
MVTDTVPSKFAVAFKANSEKASQEAKKVTGFLQKLKVKSVFCTDLLDIDLKHKIISNEFDCLIVLGGDGSMLQASHLCAKAGVPIVGINLGSFGFLFELQQDNWHDYLPLLLKGVFRREERMMLHAQLWHGKNLTSEWEVVNEVVVCRGQQVKPIHLHASVNGYPMASYVADGLIAATPTGSTAYALAAGGAIMPPELRNILIVPVAPHISLDRAIILSEGSSVSITASSTHQAVLSADGHEPVMVENEDVVKVEASERNIVFIRFQDPGFFYANLNRYMDQNPSNNAEEK